MAKPVPATTGATAAERVRGLAAWIQTLRRVLLRVFGGAAQTLRTFLPRKPREFPEVRFSLFQVGVLCLLGFLGHVKKER